jgi:outer membrane immunogenic protein
MKLQLKGIGGLFLLLSVSLSVYADEGDGFSGTYAGFELGYIKGDSEENGLAANPNWTVDNNPAGMEYGIVLGHNYSLGHQLIAGAELAYSYQADADDNSLYKNLGALDPNYPVTVSPLNAYALSGRLGYLISQNMMGYFSLGYSLVEVEHTYYDFFTLPYRQESSKDWLDGWTAGLGLEYKFDKNLSAKMEYQVAEYNSVINVINMWNEIYNDDYASSSIKIGVLYHF